MKNIGLELSKLKKYFHLGNCYTNLILEQKLLHKKV